MSAVKTYTLGDLASQLQLELKGNPQLEITGLATLDQAGPNSLSFYHNSRYRVALENSAAGAVIISPQQAENCSAALLLSDNPYLAYARATALFAIQDTIVPGIHPTAVLADDVALGADITIGPHVCIGSGTVLGAGVRVGANCVIGEACTIGANSELHAGVTLYKGCRLGARNIIHAGVVIGSDGFGFASNAGQHEKIHQLGTVVMGDDVEVGANTTIDRGALDDTVIGNGVKIDNQVQIAHNVKIGENTIICGCSAIAGSSEIGNNCIIAGAVGIINHVRICDGVTVTAMSLVSRSIDTPGTYSSGTGLSESASWKKNIARFTQLDAMWKRLIRMEAAIKDTHQSGTGDNSNKN